jgi:hypothetical protein
MTAELLSLEARLENIREKRLKEMKAGGIEKRSQNRQRKKKHKKTSEKQKGERK